MIFLQSTLFYFHYLKPFSQRRKPNPRYIFHTFSIASSSSYEMVKLASFGFDCICASLFDSFDLQPTKKSGDLRLEQTVFQNDSQAIIHYLRIGKLHRISIFL